MITQTLIIIEDIYIYTHKKSLKEKKIYLMMKQMR